MFSSPWEDLSRIFLAVVEDVDYNSGKCTLSYFRMNDTTKNISVSQPYAGRGWGLFAGIEPGSIALCAHDANSKVYILTFVVDPAFYRDDLYAVEGVDIGEFSYPKPILGEIVLQSKKNARIALNNTGDLVLADPHGNNITIDSSTDSLVQESAQRIINCEAFSVRAGSVSRDIRSAQEKTKEPLVGTASSFGFAINPSTQFIGFNPVFKPDANPAFDAQIVNQQQIKGQALSDIQKSFSIMPPGLADLRLGGSGPFNYQTDAVNPILSEFQLTLFEFNDSNIGVEAANIPDVKRKAGKYNYNLLGKVVIGTAVNDLGKTLRFDYGFHDGRVGHGTIWSTKGFNVHEDGKSTDDYFDPTNTLSESKAGRNDSSEWTVDKFEVVDTATMFDFSLRTRGATASGKLESDTEAGPKWFLRIAKDGLTKLNIPAATSIDGKEPWREGRSLLANFDGSVEASIGKQYCTGLLGLDRITGQNAASGFVNMNSYPNYGRQDRSLTLDLEGNAELLIGRDENSGQSLMIQADGSLSAIFGKEIAASSSAGVKTSLAPGSGRPISTACLATSRLDRSWTVRMVGNAEFVIGKDAELQQSLMMTTEGGNRLMMGRDTRGRSLDLHTLGGVRVEVQAPMNKQGFAFELDLNGHLHVFAQGKIHFHSTEDMMLQTEGNFHHQVGGDYLATVTGNYNLTVGGMRSVVVGSNDSATIGGMRAVTVGKTDLTTVASAWTVQSSSLIALDAPALALNTGSSMPAVPTPAVPPTPMFAPSPEVPPIAPTVVDPALAATTRSTPLKAGPPVQKALNETLEDKTGRFVDPYQ